MLSGTGTIARALRLLCVVTAVFLAQFARSASPRPNFSIQLFQSEQGLPHNNINAIIQSREGYLWLGTFGGLVRFDGVRFKVFDAANTRQLQNSRITALFEDADGTIWIGHETGDLTRLRDGVFEAATPQGPARREAVVAITRSARGEPLVLYQSASLRNHKTGDFITDFPPDQQRGTAAVAVEESGAIWVLRDGALWRSTGGKAELLEMDRYAADPLVYGVGPARGGGVWIATSGKVRKREGADWTTHLFTPGWPSDVTAMLEMRNGTLAVATMDQSILLLRTNSAPLRLNRNDGLPPDWVRGMCEDREGNLWIGQGSGGMVALRPARAASIYSNDQWRGRPLSTLATAANGHIWIGTEGAGLYRYAKGICAPFVAENAPATNSFIWSIAADNLGRIWASVADRGVTVFDGSRFQTPPGLGEFFSPVRALSPTSAGMLLGARSGLFAYENNKLVALSTNLIAPDVRCIAQQTNGVIWFGMFGGGLGRYENGAASQFRKGDGLTSDFIQALHIDREGTLWIGAAESGLVRFKNRQFRSITTANGLRDNVISHIAEDDLGHLWIASRAGVMRASKEELNRCAEGELKTVQCLLFGETDGLPSAQSAAGVQPVGGRTADGALWFATLKGIGVVHPGDVRTNQLPLVIVEEFRVNEEVVKGRSNLKIPPESQRFDFDFTAITLAAPERALFKYRLEGLEEDWVGPTTKRTVSYSHLAPGDYTFRVIAANTDGAWNESGAALAFTTLPFFWQTLSFRALVIVLALGLVAAAVLFVTRQRYRRQLELAERQRGIERERARIAQDIHDDLGSSLTRIILLSQSARGDLDSPELAAGDLDRIYDTARNLTRSLDEIVWAVNPRHDTLDSLATYLGKFAQDFLGAGQIRCRLDLPTKLPQWPLTAETRHNVFLAFKEALNNTVKHAEATEVKITLTLQEKSFTLTVEDNGKGFDPAGPRKDVTDTEDGLGNMKKRLSDVGGSCEIRSRPGEGARIDFLVVVPQHS